MRFKRFRKRISKHRLNRIEKKIFKLNRKKLQLSYKLFKLNHPKDYPKIIEEKKRKLKEKQDWKKSIKRFIHEIRNFLLNAPDSREAFSFSLIDLSQMIIAIPKKKYPLFQEILNELSKEDPIDKYIKLKTKTLLE